MANILPTKFYPPPTPAGFITRPQLLEKLKEALTHRLTLVSAPAGAGKTTLASAWAQAIYQNGIAYGWLSLDDSDNDVGDFQEYLIACLEERGIVIDTATLPSGQGEQAQIEDILADFIRGLMKLKQELVLILDDYHLIQNKEVHAALEYILRYAPPSLHLVLLTRSDPPLELARMRVTGQLVELRMEHLRFSAQEADAFLKKIAGVQLAESDVAALNERAEGWIAGLQMAAISMRGREDTASFVAAFTGSHRFVFDFLLEQVLNRQPAELREFLLKTSVLERLSIPLCDAVAETGGATRRLLDILERDNLFLVPLDDERGWYRYHHLFSDLLKLILEQNHPGLSVELHRRACRWHEAQGMLPQALHHGILSGDMQLVAQIVSANVLLLIENDEVVPTLQKIDSLPTAEINTLPWLGIARAWALAYTGQMERAEAALSLAEKQSNKLANDECGRLMGHITAVRAYKAWVHGSQQKAVELAMEAALLLPLEEYAVRALNVTTLGNALTQYGADPRAVEVLEKAVALARQAGQSHVFMPAATALAYAYIMLGGFHKAHAICLEAIDVAEAYQRHNGQPLPAAASVYAELSSILGEWGETKKSIQVARKGLALSEIWGQADTIMLCLFALANGLSLAHDAESARTVLQRARKMAQKVSPWFVLNVDQVELRIWLDADDIGQATRTAQEASTTLPASLEARLMVKQNQPDKALSLLECSLSAALNTPSLEAVRLGVIQSLAFSLKRDETRALSVLKQTLELAEPENLVATFVREGAAMERLLRLARAKSITPKFTQRLLAAFEARRKHKPEPAPVTEALIEPLSERELEILRHLNGPLSTPEIADLLVVSANTVRTHIKNIYSKLDVHGRSGAVKQAKELGLLG